MWRTKLIRFCGLAAIVAGVLRGIASVIPGTTPRIMALYFFTDVFLLFGSIGIYGFQHEEIGLTGTLGFLLQVVGSLILITRDVAVLGSGAYLVGALMFTAGLDLLAAGSWKGKRFPRWILILWVLSTIVGPIGYFTASLSVLFMVSGMLFGIAFAWGGITVLFSAATNSIVAKCDNFSTVV
ncbi:MAG TPA: hypothetical protein VE135_05095 [Pyrinomonadaceae bacterium]|nr:hypothetical protein [Pyrinomonadaceae bacterium]